MPRWLLRGAAVALLAGWAAGLAVAAVQLAAWDRDLVQALLQIRADRTFRLRMAERREPIPREWYRSKALALLAAGNNLQDDRGWARFVPGAWAGVDDLRERLAQRIEQEFGDIAVETIRRELDFHAGQLAGVPRHALTGELLTAGGCADPPLAGSFYAPGARTGQATEIRAVQQHLDAVEQLDAAVHALAQLQSPGGDGAESLRALVRYALGAELPGKLSRSAVLVRQVLQPSEPAQQAIRDARLQSAVRCSVAKRMAMLDARVFERNDLLASEEALAPDLAELYRPTAARPVPETLERWRAVVALIGEQERLLAAGASWLKGEGGSLGPVHDAVLARVARIALLGDGAVRLLRAQSAAKLQALRRQLAGSLVAGADPALVWVAAQGRFVLSPPRAALRDGLAALLQEPFMAPVPESALPLEAGGPLAWDLRRLADALQLAPVRQRFASEQLPRFPDGVRAAVARVVDRQLALQVEFAAARALDGSGAGASLDVATWRAQRLQVLKVQALLAELGARPRAERLRALLAGDLVARLAPAEDALAQSTLASARLQDFGWWGGEGAPLLAAFGVADGLTLRYVLAQQLAQLDAAARQVAVLLEAQRGGEPALQRWQGMLAEFERYRQRRADSSLLALERMLLVVGPDLTAGNCADKLAASWPPPGGTDEFAERHRGLRAALARRCQELRAPPALVPPPAVGAVVVPFG